MRYVVVFESGDGTIGVDEVRLKAKDHQGLHGLALKIQLERIHVYHIREGGLGRRRRRLPEENHRFGSKEWVKVKCQQYLVMNWAAMRTVSGSGRIFG